MSNPPRTTTAGQVFNDLRNKARREGRNTQELMIFYILERFLYRLSISTYRAQFILKGGLLLAVLDARRPTRDGDLLAYLHYDKVAVVECIRTIASIPVGDGVTYCTDQIKTVTIRDEEDYSGFRVNMPAMIGRSRVALSLDINFGDPVTPASISTGYPLLLPGDSFHVLTYPIETVLAEKLLTAIRRGENNTRDRDYADLWRLTRTHDINGDTLTLALDRTSQHRQTPQHLLSTRIGSLLGRRTIPYRRWREKQGADTDAYPQDFSCLIRDVIAFADPPLAGNVAGHTWRADSLRWIQS